MGLFTFSEAMAAVFVGKTAGCRKFVVAVAKVFVSFFVRLENLRVCLPSRMVEEESGSNTETA